MNRIAIVLALFALFGSISEFQVEGFNFQGQYVPFNCPIFVKALNMTLDLSTVPCAQDCPSNHGAYSGYCDQDPGESMPRCVCDYTNTEPAGPDPGIPVGYSSESCTAQVCQCSDISEKTFYDAVCNGDCSCNHGANFGVCDYEHKQCRCDYSTPYNASSCPIQDFFDPAHQQFGQNAAYGIFSENMNLQNAVAFVANALKGKICVQSPFSGQPPVG